MPSEMATYWCRVEPRASIIAYVVSDSDRKCPGRPGKVSGSRDPEWSVRRLRRKAGEKAGPDRRIRLSSSASEHPQNDMTEFIEEHRGADPRIRSGTDEAGSLLAINRARRSPRSPSAQPETAPGRAAPTRHREARRGGKEITNRARTAFALESPERAERGQGAGSKGHRRARGVASPGPHDLELGFTGLGIVWRDVEKSRHRDAKPALAGNVVGIDGPRGPRRPRCCLLTAR